MNTSLSGLLQIPRFITCQSPSTILDILARLRTIVQSLAGAASASTTGALNVPVTLMSTLRQLTMAILNLLISQPMNATQLMAAAQLAGGSTVICTDPFRINRDMSQLLQSLNAQQPSMVGALFVTVPVGVIQNWLALIEDALSGLRTVPPPRPVLPPVATNSGLLSPGV